MSTRSIDARYRDPLEIIWVETARAFGLAIERSREVFAAWDGQGTLQLADARDFDPDDSLAQLVFHELCHAIVEGPAAWNRPDWGLCNRDERHIVREHTAQRLQAALADAHGLRTLLAPTTAYRSYYDALPDDPLAPCDDPAWPAVRDAYERATEGPWAAGLEDALQATAALARVVRSYADDGSLWARVRPPRRPPVTGP